MNVGLNCVQDQRLQEMQARNILCRTVLFFCLHFARLHGVKLSVTTILQSLSMVPVARIRQRFTRSLHTLAAGFMQMCVCAWCSTNAAAF
jgi:hypothetical protein